MSGRANGIRVTCGRAGEVFTRWLCWQRFACPMETLHLQSRRLAEKTFFSCPVFPTFLFCLLLRTLKVGTSEWCFQTLLLEAKCLAPVLRPTNDISGSAWWLQKSHHFCLQALLGLNKLKGCFVFIIVFLKIIYFFSVSW